MSDKVFSHNIEEIVTFGLDEISPDESVEVNLKDLIYVYKTLQEYMRFFHQPTHYPQIKDIDEFLGSINDSAGFKILHASIYEKMQKMIPPHIKTKFDEGDFDCHKLPLYYNENR